MKKTIIISGVILAAIIIAAVAYMKAQKPKLIDAIVKEGGIDRESIVGHSYFKLFKMLSAIRSA